MSDQVPSTDFVYSLAAANGSLYAACASGLYHSADEGRTWLSVQESLRTALPIEGTIPTSSVALLPNSAQVLTIFTAVGGTVMRSADGGQHWTAVLLADPQPIVADLAISPDYEADGVALAATVEDGIFRTADRGQHWTAWNFGLLDLNTLCLAVSPDFAHDETIFAGTDSGLFQSTNGGRAWREVDLPVGYVPVLSIVISPDFAHDGVVFIGTEAGDVLASADGGESWQQKPLDSDGAPITTILLDSAYPAQPRILLNTGSALLLSSDNGQTWREHYAEQIGGGEISAIIAPWGLEDHVPLIAGFVGGTLCRLE